MKINIEIVRRSEYQKKCMFCERSISGEFYDLNIEYSDGVVESGRYRNICPDCHCALKKALTGVD